MPSSVVFAALVLAWLLVLVPVVARRRGMVPRTAEADLSARVLLRGAGGPVMGKIATEEGPMAHVHQDRRGTAAASVASGGTATAVVDRDDTDRDDDIDHDDTDTDVDQELDRELDLDAHDGNALDDGRFDDGGDAHDGRGRASREHVLDRGTEDDGWYDEDGDLDWADDEPRAYRPGRGGFDPEAAEVAAHARYAFRQRVALGLIAVAVLSALAALVVTATLWWLHVVTDVVLVGYLVFLRRQTRIEEEVRARRAARMSGERRALEARRERQAAHDDLMAAHQREAEDWDGWEAAAHGEPEHDASPEQELEELEEPAPRWAAPRTPAPPVPDGMELVDDSDDDPAFHALDDRDRVPSYRRAAAGA